MERIKSTLAPAWLRLLGARPAGFWPGFLVGLLYFGYVFRWMWSAHPLHSLGIQSTGLSALLLAVFHTGSAAAMAAGTGLFGFFLVRLSVRRHSDGLVPLFIAAGFTFSEYLRSYFLSIAPLGQGSVLGPHWTFGNVAYWFSGIAPILQSASLWGIYGVTFFVSLSAAVALIWSRNRKPPVASVLCLLLMFAVAAGHFLRQDRGPVTASKEVPIVIVQTEKLNRTAVNTDSLLADLGAKLELLDPLPGQLASGSIILLPEGAGLFKEISFLLDSDGLRRYIERFAPSGATILDNARVEEGGRARSRTIALSAGTGAAGHYDKNLLTPGGEFVPYWLTIPSKLMGFSQTAQIQAVRSFLPGGQENVLALNGDIFTVLICSEIISPQYARRSAADFIVGQNSLAFLGGSDTIESQLIAMARYRAAENNKYLAWASNFGRSFVLDGRGDTVAYAPSDGYQILTAMIVPNALTTWYNTLGDWPILSLSMILIGWALGPKKVKKP